MKRRRRRKLPLLSKLYRTDDGSIEVYIPPKYESELRDICGFIPVEKYTGRIQNGEIGKVNRFRFMGVVK